MTSLNPRPQLVDGVNVDAVASAVRSCPGVDDLATGALGSVASYLPGRTVSRRRGGPGPCDDPAPQPVGGADRHRGRTSPFRGSCPGRAAASGHRRGRHRRSERYCTGPWRPGWDPPGCAGDPYGFGADGRRGGAVEPAERAARRAFIGARHLAVGAHPARFIVRLQVWDEHDPPDPAQISRERCGSTSLCTGPARAAGCSFIGRLTAENAPSGCSNHRAWIRVAPSSSGM